MAGNGFGKHPEAGRRRLAERGYAGALQDFDKAPGLRPDNGRARYGRAAARENPSPDLDDAEASRTAAGRSNRIPASPSPKSPSPP